MELTLKMERATPQSFAEFGSVVIPHSREADFRCEEFDWWENLTQLALGENAEVGIVEAKNTGVYEQKTLEQHRCTGEVLIPVDNDVFLVLAKPDAFSKAERSPADFSCFYVTAGSLVSLKEGVWHQGPMTLSDSAKVFVLYRGGTGQTDKVVLVMADYGLHITVAAI